MAIAGSLTRLTFDSSPVTGCHLITRPTGY
jgi:hypothetical protein